MGDTIRSPGELSTPLWITFRGSSPPPRQDFTLLRKY
jgi:hypothetical protein